MKQIINKALGKLGYRISSTRHRPCFEVTGYTDPFQAKKQLLNGLGRITVFDVGAYHGEMAIHYRKSFPDSNVFCFEPFAESFDALKANTSEDDAIQVFNIGLADHDCESKFFSNSFAVTNSLLEAERTTDEVWGKGVVQTKDEVVVRLTTLDQFVETHSINNIDILKLDVQGAEHLVLLGATKALKRQLVRMIYSEVITLPTYKGQKQLHEMLALYHSFGFELHSIYNPSFAASGAIRQFDCLLYRREE